MEYMDINGKDYQVVKLLGHGKGGYSYLVTDGAGEYVLKQIHHEPCDYYTFGDKLQSELRDYERLMAVGVPMPRMLDVDIGQERILKEYIPGDTIYELVKKDEMREEYVSQMRTICGRLYPAGLNIDYFPTNFVVCGRQIIYVDYECNGYMDEWNFENWGIQYWSKTQAYLEYAASHS